MPFGTFQADCPTVQEVIPVKANKHHRSVENHPTPLFQQLLEPRINRIFRKL